MKDIFAELDAGNPQANVNPVSSSSSSDVFSSMDADKKPEESSLIRRGIGDPLVGLARGTAVGIPETAFGLLDIPTLGYAGKTAEAVGKGLGIGGFKEGREFFNKMLTPETQEAQQKVAEAKGIIDTIKTGVQNPSAIIQVVTDSIPAMLTGTRMITAGQKALGYGAKEIAGLTGKELLATEASNKAKQIVAGAVGESVITAGQNLEQTRQQTEDNLLTPMQVGINVASAAVTGIIGTLGGKLASRLGIEDINTLMAGGFAGANKKDLLKSVLYGAFQEGALEELPQSMQEQIAQNIALGKPIDDQVFEQGAIGLLAGIAQSTGAQAAGGMMQHLRSKDPNQQNIDTQIAGLDPETQKAIGGQDGNITGSQIDVERQVATEVDRANTIIDEEKAAAAVQPEVIPAAAITPAITPVVAPAAPTAIPDAIRTEVAGMSDTNLARTAAEDREPIVRQAATEEIQKRATSVQEALPVGEKQVATPASTIDRFLQNKSQAELAKLANENKGEPIGIAAGTLFDQRSREAAKQVTAPVVAPAAGKVDYEAQAANQGISLENFKKQDVGVLNSWAKTGVFGAQIELERRAQEGTIQPNQITWKTPEAATQPPTPPAGGGPTAPATKVPTAAPFAQEVKVKEEIPARIAKVVDYHKNVLNQGKTAEDKLKAGKALGMQMAAIQRKIEGRPTKAEFARTQKKLSSMYTGRPVTIETQPAVITGKTSFGKYQVRLQDGTEQYLPLSKITVEAVTNDEVYRHLQSEGLKALEQAEKIIAPAVKEEPAPTPTAEPTPEAARLSKLSEPALVAKESSSIRKNWKSLLAAKKVSPSLYNAVNKMLDLAKSTGVRIAAVDFEEKEYIAADIMDFQNKDIVDKLVNEYKFNRELVEKVAEADRLYRQTTDPAEREALNVTRRIFSQTGKHRTVTDGAGRNWAQITLNMGSNEYDVWHEFAHAAELQGKDLSKYGTSEEERAVQLGKLLSEGKDVPELHIKNLPAGKTKPSPDISYSIARDKGARILEEGSPKKFKTIFQIANHLSRRVPIDYQTATTTENREVERKLSDFLETCLKKVPEAKGWYKKDFARTMQILQTLDPGIKKPENNFRMRLAIAIASNGNDSVKTMDIAWSIYRNWMDNGSYSPTVDGNNKQEIADVSEDIRLLRDHFKSDLEMEKWLMGYDTPRNIGKEIGHLIGLSAGEKKDTVVPRASAVIGPKIGAFFNNLSGNFDPVTMDRWFMRTIGRITGTAVKTADVDTKREQFRNTITDDVISAVWGNELGIVRASELTEEDLDSLALAINRGKWRDLKGKYDEARNAGNRLAETLKGQLNDSPSSGGQREWIRERMEKVRKTHPQFDLSDIQAAIWIGEKELYHELGGRREKADYYSEGAEALARRTGKGELLRRTAGPAGRVRPATERTKEEQAALFSIREQRLKSGLSYQVMDMIRANPDGFTIDITTGGMVEKGYAVAPTKRTETPLDELTDENVDAFLEGNRDLFEADDRAFFGGWFDQDEKSANFGKYVLDVSYVVDSYEDAVYIAEIGAQDGIYHIEAKQYIPTRDGLKDLKTRGLFKAGERAKLRRIQESMHRIIESRRPDQGKVNYSVRRTARPVRPAGQLANRRRPGEVQGQIRIDSGVHWSSQPRKELDSKYYGTGLADATSRRLPSDPKSPLRHRIHFYYNPGTGMPPPEVGVGPYAHDVDLSKYKIFDLSSGAIKISQVEGEDWRNTLEKALLKAGFDGFANPDYGVAVLLGKRKVAVQPVEIRYSIREADARYLELAKEPEKNKAELQKMVADAAKATVKFSKGLEGEIAERLSRFADDLADGLLEEGETLSRSDVLYELMQDMDEKGTPAYQFRSELRSYGIKKGVYKEVTQAEIDKTVSVGGKYDFKKDGKFYRFSSWDSLDEDTGSDLLSENGEPLVMYHGTNTDISSFKTSDRDGIYFSSDSNYAKGYGETKADLFGGRSTLYPVYLFLKNPLVLDGEDAAARGKYIARGFNKQELSAQGYDGVVMKYADGETEAMAFDPTQIKSADPVTYDDQGNVIPLSERFNPEEADIRYSLRELIPEWLNTTIGAGLANFTTNPQGLPRAEVEKVADELKTHKDFSKVEYALSVPARMAQKHPKTWGRLYRIFAVDREETRDELRHEFQKMAEPFLMYDQQLRKKKLSKETIAASMDRVQRAIIVGDTVATEFTDEQLTEGINDKYGQEIKLNKDEIAAYRSVRNTLRHIRTVLVNHLANQSLRGYRRNKWFRILEAAMKGDSLNAETIQTLLDKKGMKQAALDRAKKLQPDITKIFERIEAGVDKIPKQEVVKAGKAYEKIANSMQAELTELQGYVSELTGVTDKTELSAMTREIFSAYMQTRPQMKIIRALRNEVGSLDGYFPRFRETGDKKFRVYLQELDENGNVIIDEETGKEVRKEVYMGMFSNARQGNDIIRDAMKKLKIKESDLTPDGKFPPQYYVEIARQTASPESAYQGVNDINLQRIFDDAMRAAQEKGVHGLDATYTDANGNEVNVFEQIRQAGLQSLTNHLKARGAMQRSIKRSEDLIEGYQETGLQRVLLDYITSMSGLMTKQVAASEAMELLSTIKDPFLFASMSRYTREMLRNNSLADRISGYTRAAAFTYFLGGLLKSAVVNMTQNPIVGFAELGKFMREHKLGGAGKSDVLYAKAMKDVLSGNLTADEKAFIDKMVNRGIATNQFIQAVFDNVMNKGLRRHIAIMNFMAKPFSMSEVFNRKSAAIAMYRAAYDMRLAQAKASGLTGAAAATEAERMTFDDARDFVTNVHYAYGKTNRPLPIMTGDALGAVASSLYTFKGFSHNFLARQAELLSKGDFRTLGHTLAYLVLFGGLSTFPFLRDLFDWWEKEYGYNPMNQVRASLRGIGGETLEKFGVSGLPSVLGANFSGSLAVGLPWPIGASSPEDSIFGVWAGVMTKAKRSAEALSHGDLNRGITEISPEFMRAPRVAIRESEIGKQLFGAPGYATNIRGHAILGEDGKPISLSSWEAALKALGFNPTSYARAKEKTQNVVRQVAWVNDLKQNVAERYRAARLNNDKDAVKDMMANVKEVNQKIRSRNLQQLVTPLKISNVMKSAMPKIGAKERREMLYKRQVL